MAKMKKKIAILIVSYNGRVDLSECLSSLTRDSYESIDQYIYVVDNASNDGSIEYLEANWPHIHIIKSETNTGFSGGNNIGWNAIRFDIPDIDYLMLLNQDTIASRNFLEPLIEVMEHHQNVGSVQPLLKLYPEKHKINSLGNIIQFLGFGYSSFNGFDETKVAVTDHSINYASGSAVMLRRNAIDQVGLFDDFMFMYQEDLDLGWRLYLAIVS